MPLRTSFDCFSWNLCSGTYPLLTTSYHFLLILPLISNLQSPPTWLSSSNSNTLLTSSTLTFSYSYPYLLDPIHFITIPVLIYWALNCFNHCLMPHFWMNPWNTICIVWIVLRVSAQLRSSYFFTFKALPPRCCFSSLCPDSLLSPFLLLTL